MLPLYFSAYTGSESLFLPRVLTEKRLAHFFSRLKGTLLDVATMFTGGALENFSIFALGIMPYISASIIIQLLTSVVPKLEALKKEGESGRQKITQWTRYLTVSLVSFRAL